MPVVWTLDLDSERHHLSAVSVVGLGADTDVKGRCQKRRRGREEPAGKRSSRLKLSKFPLNPISLVSNHAPLLHEVFTLVLQSQITKVLPRLSMGS